MRSADRYYCVEGLTDFFASCHGLVRFSRSMGAVSQFFGGEIASGKHLFPFRTEPLSLSAPMVLGGQPPGRVGRRRSYLGAAPKGGSCFTRQRRVVLPDLESLERAMRPDAAATRRDRADGVVRQMPDGAYGPRT